MEASLELTLQQILDALAERVGRPAVLEDRFMRLIAFSSHDQPLDEVRENSILRRHASTAVRSWLEEFGLPDARRPFRLPANPDLRMLPRVCVPVLRKDKLLGHLWFVDPDGSMGSPELDLCVREAAELGELLHRESVASLFSTARMADTMHMLLSNSPMSRQAARSLTEAGYIYAEEGIVAIVFQGVSEHRSAGADVEDALAQAIAAFRRLLRRGQALDLISRDQCVLLLACAGDDDPHLAEQIDVVVEITRTTLAATGSAASLVVGVGGQRASLEEAYSSLCEAHMSADAARLLPGLGDVVYWSRLGIHQIVVRLASLGEEMPAVHPGLGHLLDDPDALPLLETLETYLDVAGNAQLTAERLNLHRTSLYYRLQRLEQLAHTDLKNGMERLSLHLALKVARMTGQYTPRHAGPGSRPPRPHLPMRAHQADVTQPSAVLLR